MKTLFLILMTAGVAFAGDVIPGQPDFPIPNNPLAGFQARMNHNYEQARQDAFNQDVIDRLDAIAAEIHMNGDGE
jgi:hypothetical protein